MIISTCIIPISFYVIIQIQTKHDFFSYMAEMGFQTKDCLSRFPLRSWQKRRLFTVLWGFSRWKENFLAPVCICPVCAKQIDGEFTSLMKTAEQKTMPPQPNCCGNGVWTNCSRCAVFLGCCFCYLLVINRRQAQVRPVNKTLGN